MNIEKSNIHSGHRQRMFEKLIQGGAMQEHELLEMLLFAGCPRKNTNEIAHVLLDRFCGINKVLNASFGELITVPGVGKSIAHYIITLGKCFNRIEADKVISFESTGDFKRFVTKRLNELKVEVFEIYCLDKSRNLLRTFSYNSGNRHSVTVKTTDIMHALTSVKPTFIFVAHNHIDGTAGLSEQDKKFTKELYLACRIINVELLDHLVYCNGECYSSRTDGLLYDICNKVIKNINELHK